MRRAFCVAALCLRNTLAQRPRAAQTASGLCAANESGMRLAEVMPPKRTPLNCKLHSHVDCHHKIWTPGDRFLYSGGALPRFLPQNPSSSQPLWLRTVFGAGCHCDLSQRFPALLWYLIQSGKKQRRWSAAIAARMHIMLSILAAEALRTATARLRIVGAVAQVDLVELKLLLRRHSLSVFRTSSVLANPLPALSASLPGGLHVHVHGHRYPPD